MTFPGSLRPLVAFLLVFAHSGKLCAIDVGTGAAFQRQQLESWGTSLAWWANGIGDWQDTQMRDEVMDLIFDPANGLGFNYARYNIGGGQNRFLSANFRPGAFVPGWVPNAPSAIEDTATWVWDWQADPRQRLILDAAIARGVDVVDAVSYSAPFWMTISQDTAGGPGGGDNILQQHVDEYAHYQTEVVKHFRDQLDIEFGTFDPMNEPHATWWAAGGQQEGMHVSQGFDQRILIETAGQQLAAKGLRTSIAAADEFSANSTNAAWSQYNSFTKSFITKINTHVYGGTGSNPTSAMTQLRNTATAEGVKLYQSEYGNNSTTGLLGGVALADRITQDLNIMGVDGWTFWQVMEPISLAGAGWGLLWGEYSQTASSYTIRKQYHVMRQFSSHIQPGSTILSTTDSDTVAAYDPVTETTTLVVTNQGFSTVNKSFTLVDGAPAFSRVIQTSNAADYRSLGPADIAGAQVSHSGPGPSVTTIILHNKPNLIQNADFVFSGGNSGSTALNGNWQANGNAAFYDNIDHSGNGSGAAALHANSVGNSGAISQKGIGGATTDLTGVAYQFSVDALFQQDGLSKYNADTRIALEFYGADDATLVQNSVLDFSTSIAPIVEDSNWRTFRTPILIAPAGTRFVRPVVRFDNVETGSNEWVGLDDVYLQEVNYVPRGRQWLVDGNGNLEDTANWNLNSSVPLNNHAYFGPHITQPSTITLNEDATLHSLTFDSSNLYRVLGTGDILLDAEGGERSLVDVRQGNPLLLSNTQLQANAVFQTLAGTSLSVNGTLDVAGNSLLIQGAGDVSFGGGITLDGGSLGLFAENTAPIAIGPTSILDGSLDIQFVPGDAPQIGEIFELATYTGSVLEFDLVNLPSLPAGMDWQLAYLSSSLVAEIIAVLAGDYNGDGTVNAADYAVWLANLGSTTNTAADGDGSGTVDLADYHIWKTNIGRSAVGGVSTEVPEPSTTVILLISMLFVAVRFLWRRGSLPG